LNLFNLADCVPDVHGQLVDELAIYCILCPAIHPMTKALGFLSSFSVRSPLNVYISQPFFLGVFGLLSRRATRKRPCRLVAVHNRSSAGIEQPDGVRCALEDQV
jgi:hypothetical protein